MTQQPVLELRNVEKYFDQSSSIVDALKSAVLGKPRAKIRAVDGVDLALREGQVQGVIGESGCGKTTLIETLMGLNTPTGGDILFDGQPVSEFTKEEWKRFRRRVQIIFQDPFNSMDPKFTVRETLREPLNVHGIGNQEERIMEILDAVKLNPPEKYIDRLPQQLSGGEKQRVSIARGLILEPDLLLADEPVSMLDVSTQAAILQDLSQITEEQGVSMLYISHDLSTVSYVCDRVNVMYLGRIVESAETNTLLSEPKHPYTRALIKAIPIPDPHYDRERTSMQGTPSDATDLPKGCRFKDRCPERMDICDVQPEYRSTDDGTDHRVACHLYYDHEIEGGERSAADPSGQRRQAQ